MGDKLANILAGLQPLFSRRRNDRGIRDLVTFAHTEAGACRFPSPPSEGSTRRSEAEVLSKATLMGDGQAGLWVRNGRVGEVLAEGGSVMPEYTARWGTGVVKRHSCEVKGQQREVRGRLLFFRENSI